MVPPAAVEGNDTALVVVTPAAVEADDPAVVAETGAVVAAELADDEGVPGDVATLAVGVVTASEIFILVCEIFSSIDGS